MKLWVTGADGLLGSALRKHAFVATNRGLADLSNLEALRLFALAHPGITHIVNCAAFSLVDPAETRREEAFCANAIGPQHLAIVAREIGARLLHISTDYVFRGDLHRPLTESDPTDPCNYYGVTKLEGEKRVFSELPSACVLRTSWIFGEGGKNFVATLLTRMRELEEVYLTADHWGRPTYTEDLVNAILCLADCCGLYQFANGGAATKHEFGVAMKQEAEMLGIPLAVKKIIAVPGSHFSSAAKRPVYSAFDTTKIEQIIGSPIRPWRDALREHMASYG